MGAGLTVVFVTFIICVSVLISEYMGHQYESKDYEERIKKIGG